MALVGIRPLVTVKAGPNRGDMTGHAPIYPIDIHEVDVVVQPRQNNLFDLEVGLDEVHQGEVEEKVGDVLGQSGNPVFQRIEVGVNGGADFMVMMCLATTLASLGLLQGSSAVVIGAMLVAPLMSPVMAAAGAVVMGWPGRFYGALWLVFAMGLGALLLSSLITVLSPDLVFLPEQVLARTRPTFYDLLIALAAGSAGAYTITRKETSAIPGVAVAVALLPSLASAGILLTSG